jgi:hypothetical protein
MILIVLEHSSKIMFHCVINLMKNNQLENNNRVQLQSNKPTKMSNDEEKQSKLEKHFMFYQILKP